MTQLIMLFFQRKIQPAGKGVDQEVCHVEDVGHLGLRVGSAAKLEEKEKFLKIVDSHSRECFCASIIIILFKVAIYWKAMHLPSSSVLKQTSAHFVIQPTMFQIKIPPRWNFSPSTSCIKANQKLPSWRLVFLTWWKLPLTCSCQAVKTEDLIVFQDPKLFSERVRPVQHKLLPTRHCPRLHHIHLQDSCGENSNRIPPVGKLHKIYSDQLNMGSSCRSRRQNICAMYLFGGTVLLQLRSATMSIHQE